MKRFTAKNTLIGSLFIVIASLMYGSYGVFSNSLEQYDVLFQTYVRCLIVTAVFGGWGIYQKAFKKIEKEDWKWFATVLIFTCFSIAPIVYAFRYLSLGTASFLFYASFTIFTYIFGFIFFKEKLTAVKIISLLSSFTGMMVIFSFNFSWTLLLPILMAVLNGLASSGEITFSKKISDKYSNTQINTMIFGIIAVTHLILSLLIGETQNFSLLTISFPVLFLFVIAAIIGMYTSIEGYKFIEPSIGSIIGLTEIIFSALFGILFFQEQLTTNLMIGGLLILFAAALPNLVKLQQLRIVKRNT